MDMEEIAEYQLVIGDPVELNKKISELIGKGWQPFGSPVVRDNHWGQAMVKGKTPTGPSGKRAARQNLTSFWRRHVRGR